VLESSSFLSSSSYRMPLSSDDDGFIVLPAAAATKTTSTTTTARSATINVRSRGALTERNQKSSRNRKEGNHAPTTTESPSPASTFPTNRGTGPRHTSRSSSPKTQQHNNDRRTNPVLTHNSSRQYHHRGAKEGEGNDGDDGSSSSSSSDGSVGDNPEEERVLSSHLRTPAGDSAMTRRRLAIGTVGRLAMTTSPQTPASEPGMLTSSGSKQPPPRRKIKYNPSGSSGTTTRIATEESNNNGRMVHSERLRRTVNDDAFQVTPTSGDISTWDMRQRFQREFPGEPVPTSTVLLHLYKDDKVAESKRMERYKSEFPGEPIPSDEVLKKLYTPPQPAWGTTQVGMVKASAPSFQQSLQRLVKKTESLSTSSTHSGSTWITPDFSMDHDQFSASHSATPSLEGIEEKSSSNRKKKSSSTHYRSTNEETPFHESIHSISESMQNSSSFSSMEKIQKPSSNNKNMASFPLQRDNNHYFNRSTNIIEEDSKNLHSDFVMNSSSFASLDKIEKPSSSRRKKSVMQQDRKGQQPSHDSSGVLSVETFEKPASDKSKSPRDSFLGPKKEKRREKSVDRNKGRERSAERRRKSDPTDKSRDRSRERSRKSETIDKIREKSLERSKDVATSGRNRHRSVERTRKSRSRSVERTKKLDIDKNPDKYTERLKKSIKQTVTKKKSAERPMEPPTLMTDESRSSRGSRTSGELPAWQLREKWRSGSRPKSTPVPMSAAREGVRDSNEKPAGEKPKHNTATKSFDGLDDFERSFSGDPFGSATLQSKPKNKSTLESHEDLQRSFNVDPFATVPKSSVNGPFDAFGVALEAPAVQEFDAFGIQPKSFSPAGQDNLFQARPKEGSNLRGGAASRSFDDLNGLSFGNPTSSRGNDHSTAFDILKNNRENAKVLPVRSRSGDVPNITVQRKRSGVALRTSTDPPLAPLAPSTMGMLRPPKRDSRSKQTERMHHGTSPGWGIGIPVELQRQADADDDDSDAHGISIHLNHNEAPLSPMTVATKKGPVRPMRRRGRY
jgi:hypothetical protein